MTFHCLIQSELGRIYFRSVVPVVLLLHISFPLVTLKTFKTSWCSLLCIVKSTTVRHCK